MLYKWDFFLTYIFYFMKNDDIITMCRNLKKQFWFRRDSSLLNQFNTCLFNFLFRFYHQNFAEILYILVYMYIYIFVPQNTGFIDFNFFLTSVDNFQFSNNQLDSLPRRRFPLVSSFLYTLSNQSSYIVCSTSQYIMLPA